MALQLTKNQLLVFERLSRSGQPMTAYEILDSLSSHGISNPPTVYRALRSLIRRGLVHRIESTNSYVRCDASHALDQAPVFAICIRCGKTLEICDQELAAAAGRCASRQKFFLQQAHLELTGVCSECEAKTS